MGKGIDVANCNGYIDWQQVSKEVDFVIIRAGYGKDNVDESLFNNAHGAQDNGILMGMYWFSYAHNTDMAKDEADYCCNQADKYSISKFIAYDFEYHSVLYANKKGVQCTKSLVTQMALAFCRQVKSRGYVPALYFNKDYSTNYFNIEELKAEGIQLWYAYYHTDCDRNDVVMQQYSSKGKVSGIATYVDMDKEYSIESPLRNEWIKENGKWWYRHTDGSYTRTEWEKISGKWYYFDSQGWMMTGWIEYKGYWFYCDESGAMVSNCFLKINGELFAFGENGHMLMTDSRGVLK